MMELPWHQVQKTDSCWLWTGATNSGGYGNFRVGAKQKKVHRVFFEALKDVIPPGLVIDHLCRVRNCVNPAHLEAVTTAENIRRGRTGKHQTERTHCPHGHEYTPQNTYHRKDGKTGRICRTCSAARMRRSRLLPEKATSAGSADVDSVPGNGAADTTEED